MTLFWLSLVWFVATCGAAIWVFFQFEVEEPSAPPAGDHPPATGLPSRRDLT